MPNDQLKPLTLNSYVTLMGFVTSRYYLIQEKAFIQSPLRVLEIIINIVTTCTLVIIHKKMTYTKAKVSRNLV
jgi:hypothetical protein